MSKNKASQKDTTPDPVELSNADDAPPEDRERSQAEALRVLAEDRAKRIQILERERDQWMSQGKPGGGSFGSAVRIASVEVLHAPEHALIVRVLGDVEDLEKLRIKLAQEIAALEQQSPDAVTVETERLPGEVVAAIGEHGS